MPEILDIVDESGTPTGETIDRETAHRDGIRHRTSHIWIYKIEAGRPYLLLQKRSDTKDSFPGCYDTSSAGHIPAGEDFETSALRELKEELGLAADASELIDCGLITSEFRAIFHGRPFHDSQVTKVFLLRRDGLKETDLTLQKEEVSSARFFPWDEAITAIKNKTLPNAIAIEELAMLGAGEERLRIHEQIMAGKAQADNGELMDGNAALAVLKKKYK